ncbi:histidine kinase [Ekhidna sp.]|uniref:tetratricopeptide repeat-containing sensor histidine kinase n=1 Tax=Ekhidna sp. TaxID=2608089 RepID=UPI0035139A4B
MKKTIHLSFLILLLNGTLAQGQEEYSELIDKAQSFESSNPDSVLHFAWKALESDHENSFDAFYWMGVGLRHKNKYDSALYWFQQSDGVAETDIQKANVKMGLGGIFYSKRSFDAALTNFLQAAEYFDKAGNRERLGSAYTNIGIIMNTNDNDNKALHYFKSAIEIFNELKLEDKKLPALVNISTVYQKQEKYDSAILYAQQCFEISERMNFKFGQAKALVVLAPSFTKSGHPHKGYELAKQGKALFEEMGALETTRLMKLFEAEALLQLNRVAEAMSICKELESLELELSMKEHLFETMAIIYETMGKPELALSYQKKFFMVYKEYMKEEQSNYLNELEAQFEAELKASEIVRLQNQIAIQKLKTSRQNWIIGSFTIFAILVAIAIWFYYQKRLSKAKEQSAIHKQQLLRSQINPHFIFNSLSSIRGFLFESGDTKPAITYLGKFAKLMRMILDLSSKEWVSLEEEMRALELYLEIQQLRFNKTFEFKFSIDPELRLDEILVPPLTAQPFIENAIEHGLKGIENDGVVEIECLKKDRKLVFKIQDNGIGIDHVTPKENHQSHAIRIFTERLSLIGKRMKMRFQFKIADLGNKEGQHGTLVTYELPLLKA